MSEEELFEVAQRQGVNLTLVRDLAISVVNGEIDIEAARMQLRADQEMEDYLANQGLGDAIGEFLKRFP